MNNLDRWAMVAFLTLAGLLTVLLVAYGDEIFRALSAVGLMR